MTRPPSFPSGTGDGHPSTPPAFIGRYQVLEKIGEGGMGSLYVARDPAIDRLVALKVLRRGFDTDALRERFAREARAAGRLRHKNIVTIFDVGEHDSDPFIAMEFLAGETVAELIREGARLSVSRRVQLLEELCDGLAYAHRAGMVHRDVKPANLMIDAGGVLKILDFGIVRLDEAGITQAGVLVGTINYMSPEQVMGAPVDHRSDIFAVGLVAYEVLTGRRAFPGNMKEGLLSRILDVNIEPLPQAAPGLDPEVIAIVERALQKDPADRYQDLVRMRNDLTRVRDRLETEEERAASEAVAGAEETALIAREPGSRPPGVSVPSSSPGVTADAERALSEGNYRVALTLAGRSAAINPDDRSASGIVARAEAGLLDRGRLSGSGGGIVPAATPPPPPQPAPPPSVSVESVAQASARTGRGNQILVLIAILALVIAGVALWSRATPSSQAPPPSATPSTPASSERPGTDAASPYGGAIPNPPGAVVAPPVGVSGGRAGDRAEPAPVDARDARRQPAARGRQNAGQRPVVPPPARPSIPPSQGNARAGAPEAPPVPAPSSPPAPVRADRDVPVPRQTRHVGPEYPSEAAAERIEGSVGVEITIGSDGSVADARVVRSVPRLDRAALNAVRQWEYAPTFVAGVAVPVIHTVNVPFTAPAPPAVAPAPPVPRPAPPAATKPAEQPAVTPTAPPSDPRTEIRDVLRRYEAAWEALDPAALERVQVLSRDGAASVRQTMAGAASYAIDMTVHEITVDPSGKKATARCTIVRRYRPRIGTAPTARATNTVHLERRGDSWVIVGIR